jgi:Protein of unknown function (DUF2950)
MKTARSFLLASALSMALGGSLAAAGHEKPESFATPQAGFDALVGAVRTGDTKTLEAILGPDGNEIVESGDPVADKEAGRVFLAAYDLHSKIVQPDGSHAVLQIGADDWPLPIPLVKSAQGWRFDASAGKHELLARRIGRNELNTIQACLAYVDAQREYADNDHGDGVLDYAQRFVSSQNKHDGLYWPANAGDPKSPLGPAFAMAQLRGYALGAGMSREPYHGYYFKILTGQGKSAPGGAYSYLADKRMIGGFALVAYPARYGASGVMTFVVNQDGVVYQKDLGPRTGETAERMTLYDPGPGWSNTTS